MILKNITFILFFILLYCKNDIQRPSILSLFLPQGGSDVEKLGVVSTDFSSGGRFSMIDTSSLVALPTLSYIHSDAVVRFYNQKIYIVNRLNRDSILILNPLLGYLPLQEFSMGSGSNPQDIAVVNDSKAYVSLYNRTYLAVVDLNTGQIYKKIDLAVYSETFSTSSSGIDGKPEMAKMIIYENILYLQLQRLDRNDISGFPSPNTDSYIIKINIITDEIISVIKTLYPNPFGKMQKITLGSENFIAVCLPARLGYISQLDGGIGALNIATGEFRTSPLYSEKDAGGDILDMVIKTETEGYAYVLDSSFNKSIQRFNPSSGVKTGTLATYSSNLGNISGLVLSQSGKLFLGSADYNNPGITVFETANGELRQITASPISVG
ncbi:MAG: hypothetical protein EBS19_07175, partial [Spirochaetia bacterium]|nr:hypothetical protein [Spirochaetia bacterium]